jgi:succinylarginine dihydrolase
MSKVYEVNFDGLIGPTHNFSGLAFGNQASLAHKFQVSHPQNAALEGLNKMKLLYSKGMKQGFIPPPLRPHFNYLKKNGFQGTDEEILDNVNREKPELLRIASSASSMWTANAATVSPAVDTLDGKIHLTTANLCTHPHRAMEAEETYLALKEIFSGDVFKVHAPLCDSNMFDEGAANHMRLATSHHCPGIHVFVYGRQNKLPARQNLEASQQIARNHQLNKDHVLFIQQNPEAIDGGVFHNDVIATSNEHFLIYHEEAFVNTKDAVAQIKDKFKVVSKGSLDVLEISSNQLSLEEAVGSYLFNSQIVTRPDGAMALIAPMEAKEGKAKNIIDEILKGNNPVQEVHYICLRESMANGGGPACLRLRVVLNEEQFKNVHPGFLLNEEKFIYLETWIRTYYREELHIRDLASSQLLDESKAALHHLKEFLNQ